MAALTECVSCSCFAARRLARVITQHYDRHLRPTGLRPTQFTLLVVLCMEGPLPLSRVAEYLDTERTTLSRKLQPLIAGGLLTREPGEDRRIQMVAITAKGRAALRAALPRWRKAQREIAQRVPAGTLQALGVASRAAAQSRRS